MSIFSRFVSIDIETTGLDADDCQVIEIGAVIDDWLVPVPEPPEFHCYIKRGRYSGQPYALSMHPLIFRRIATEEPGFNYYYERQAVRALGKWMRDWGAYDTDEVCANVAGKNFASFDDKFLRKLNDFDCNVRYRHRIIDPANMYWDPLTDDRLPGTQTCMERAGIDGEVSHTALEDAKVVVKLIQIGVGRRVSVMGLLKVYKERGIEIPDWLDLEIDPMIGSGPSSERI